MCVCVCVCVCVFMHVCVCVCVCLCVQHARLVYVSRSASISALFLVQRISISVSSSVPSPFIACKIYYIKFVFARACLCERACVCVCVCVLIHTIGTTDVSHRTCPTGNYKPEVLDRKSNIGSTQQEVAQYLSEFAGVVLVGRLSHGEHGRAEFPAQFALEFLHQILHNDTDISHSTLCARIKQNVMRFHGL